MPMDYTTVTEEPGTRVTREAASMIMTRYAFAADLCRDCSVLEVASGPGIGLGYLARKVRSLVGTDCTESFLRQAHRHYQSRINLVRMDAHSLPFSDHSFDAVICFEAIYYLAQPQVFLDECRRVLRPDGSLLICSVNPQWPGFNPSPFSVKYFAAIELESLLRASHFDTQMFAAFPLPRQTPAGVILLHLRKLAVRLDLIPHTMRGKEVLKRMVSGSLVSMPTEITDNYATRAPIVPLAAGTTTSHYKVLYAVGRKKPQVENQTHI